MGTVCSAILWSSSGMWPEYAMLTYCSYANLFIFTKLTKVVKMQFSHCDINWED